MSELSALEFVSSARSYLGTPFQHSGRSRSGLDCVGLVVCALGDLGWKPTGKGSSLFRGYRKWPKSEELMQGILEECRVVELNDAQAGDVVLFCWPQIDRDPRHIAIVTSREPTRIIHSHWLAPGNCVCEHGLDDTWRQRVVSCWRPLCFEPLCFEER